ncbi:MAG: murA [Patescibacteria group bacterium]|jgi:UDP-N-acetylglucosamine 1-carboxyvinyltransferase|nr:murA [Patescibacteria group bacterium]
MSQFRITGKKSLHGNVTISGRKNAALKLIAATLLSDQPVTLHNVPEIGDVMIMLQVLEQLGATITREGSTVIVHTPTVTSTEIPTELGRKLRASLVFVGPLLSRSHSAAFPHPGGCVIGKRSITPHLEAFKQLGANLHFDGSIYHLRADQLKGQEIYLKERSVTATENLIMAAARAEGTTTILNAAEETHIGNLCDLLRAMGYVISGDGTSKIVIQGQPELQTTAAEVTILPDEIEVGTYAVAAAVTGGDVILHKVGTRLQLLPILSKLDDFNVYYKYDEGSQILHILPSPELRASDIQTNPWPGFPADLQSPFTVLATQAKGTSLVHDWMYEGRLYFVDLLQKMEANIIICDPHRAIVNGPTLLKHSSSITPDLRAGAALVIAALAAEGTSIIEHAELIDRGYAKIEQNLRALGADITRE